MTLRMRGGSAGRSVFLESLKVVPLGERFGDVESLAEHRSSMTLASLPPGERRKLGITDDLIRLSVGVEDAKDLVDDVTTALRAALPRR